MSFVKAGNIRKGMYLLFKNDPHQVTKTEFVSPGKGSAFTRVKLKNVRTGYTQEFTYKSHEQVEEVEVTNVEMQFSYQDGDDVVFMDPRTYEQATVPSRLIEDKLGYLVPELTMYVSFYDDRPIGVSFPQKVTLTVTQAEDAVAGNTVGAAKKPVMVETGVEILAPLFVKTGDKIIVDTETGAYLSRA